MTRLSIVCVYDNQRLYETVLLKSVRQQTFADYEVIGLDNRNGKYKSASRAYNRAIQDCRGELVVFVHQDVAFCEDSSLRSLWEQFTALERIFDTVTIGAMGAMITRGPWGFLERKVVVGKGFRQDYRPQRNVVHCPTQVQTIDECLLAIARRHVIDNPFLNVDSVPWDLYTALYTYSLLARRFRNFVIPLQANHVTTLKYIPSISEERPSVDTQDYLRTIARRMASFYRGTAAIESLIKPPHGFQSGQAPLACCSARYPIPSRRLTLYRGLLSLVGTNDTALRLSAPLLAPIVRIRLARAFSMSPVVESRL